MRGAQGPVWKWQALLLPTFLWPELNHMAPGNGEKWRRMEEEEKLGHQHFLSLTDK